VTDEGWVDKKAGELVWWLVDGMVDPWADAMVDWTVCPWAVKMVR
jgi:hypothetical protein